MSKGLVVAIEGLIGCGKSTLTESLCVEANFVPFNEPVESNPFLDDYYKAPHRWSYAMQVNLLWERFKMFQEAHYRSLRGEVCIADRSFYGDLAFGLVQQRDGYFTDKEFASYKRMHEAVQSMLPFPDLILYLDISPEEVVERIQKRSRGCENGIALDYLRHLDKAYRDVLECLNGKCKIIHIDARQTAYGVFSDAANIIADEKDSAEARSIIYR